METIRAERLKDPSFASSLSKMVINGSIICFPTDTCYALGTNALNEQAVYNIFIIKDRALSKPLPVIVRDIDVAKRFATVNDKAIRLFERFPGISLVLPKRNVPDIVNPSRIMMRIPDSDIVRDLMANIPVPVISTSANRAGDPNPYSMSDVIDSLRAKLSLIHFLIDGGRLGDEPPSTIFDCIEGRVYREGKHSADDVLEVFNASD